jgi:CheY-like chemotaxis protein
VKVLLVCDSPTVSQQVSSALLGGADTVVTEVRTAQRALRLIDGVAPDGEAEGAGPFDLVIADADTHPTGGFALCREIKARGQMGQTVPPVLLLIAREQDAWLSDWAQADAHVRKPPDPFDLAEVIDALVSRRPIPQLPGVGGSPKPSLLDLPERARAAAARDRTGQDEIPSGDATERPESEGTPESVHGPR